MSNPSKQNTKRAQSNHRKRPSSGLTLKKKTLDLKVIVHDSVQMPSESNFKWMFSNKELNKDEKCSFQIYPKNNEP